MPIVPPPCSYISIISSITETQEFSWNILSTIEIEKTFSFTVGEGPLYWFVVESVQDNTCPSLPCDFVETRTVLATSVDHLCQRLKDMGFSRLISSVKRWTRPALVCDIAKATREGIEYNCNELISMDFCVSNCFPFLPSGVSCISNIPNELIWYSEYFFIDPIVELGDSVILGQKIGTINFSPFYFGIGDGQAGGTIGQTLNFDNIYNFPAVNTRPLFVTPPNATIFNNDELAFVRTHTKYPIDFDACFWEQDFNDAAHSNYEYYAIDLLCTSGTVGKSVFNACGGIDVYSEVIAKSSNSVIIKHTRMPLFQVSMAEEGFAMAPMQITQPKNNNIVILENNLKEMGILGDFLKRNNINLNLKLAKIGNTYQYNEKFVRNKEEWLIFMDLQDDIVSGRFTRKYNNLTKKCFFKYDLRNNKLDFSGDLTILNNKLLLKIKEI